MCSSVWCLSLTDRGKGDVEEEEEEKGDLFVEVVSSMVLGFRV